MTADHAGQTGGERDPHWIKDHYELDGDAGGEREQNARRFAWFTTDELLAEVAHRRGTPSRPVPVPGQALGAPLGEAAVGQAARERDTAAPERDTSVPLAAREAAVEAVARWLCAYLAPNFPGGLDAMDDGPGHPFRLRAMQILDLPAVAALSAAPALSEHSVSTTDALSAAGGQDEWVRCSCGRAVPCRHCNTDGQEQP